MAVERRNPLPPGRYSVFLLVEDVPGWRAWTLENAATVRTVQSIAQKALEDEDDPVWSITPTGEVIENVRGHDVLFEVTAPTPWTGPGLPDIENRAPEVWVEEHTEDPADYLPPTTSVATELKNLVLLSGALYLGGVLLNHALTRKKP